MDVALIQGIGCCKPEQLNWASFANSWHPLITLTAEEFVEGLLKCRNCTASPSAATDPPQGLSLSKPPP